MTAAWYHSGGPSGGLAECGQLRGVIVASTRAADRRQGANLLDRGQQRRRVGVRVRALTTPTAPVALAAEREVGDVDAVAAENVPTSPMTPG